MGGAPIGGIIGGIIPGGHGGHAGRPLAHGGITIGGKWGGIPGGPIFEKTKIYLRHEWEWTQPSIRKMLRDGFTVS